jgi:hypothetical protein
MALLVELRIIGERRMADVETERLGREWHCWLSCGLLVKEVWPMWRQRDKGGDDIAAMVRKSDERRVADVETERLGREWLCWLSCGLLVKEVWPMWREREIGDGITSSAAEK